MITAQFLQQTALFVNSRVAKVVLNGTYELTDFQVKQVTDNVLALNYIVPAADISQITQIELLDSTDNVISSNEVSIPITTDHRMIQTIKVREASV